MDKNEVLKILETAKDENGEVPMRLVRQAFEKLPEHCEDTISRQAAIDAVEGLPNCYNGYYDAYDKSCIIGLLEELPPAQPEKIRCEDCKYWQDQEEGIVEVPRCARPQNKYEKFPLVMLIDGDGFCSYAERRADETY